MKETVIRLHIESFEQQLFVWFLEKMFLSNI